MIDQVRSAVNSLRSSRAQHGHAIRQTRRVGVELVRAAIEIALPMIAHETTSLPKALHSGEGWVGNGSGFVLVDDREYDRVQRGHDEWEENDGWMLWVRTDGSLVVGYVRERTPRWEKTTWEFSEPPQAIGIREAVRRFGAARIVGGIVTNLADARDKHDASTADELATARRLRAALAALKCEVAS